MDTLAKLPIGISSFEVLRTRGNVYVDKTEDIYHLLTEGMYYFLARPRRFGKSLLVSTLRCLFEGKRELFEGLWLVEHSDWDWPTHPVVFLDFNGISHDTPQHFEIALKRALLNIAKANQLILDAPLLKEQFKELILKLQRSTSQPVVVLIDEYDKPIIDHLGQGETRLQIAEANRDIQKQFFGVLKDGDVMDVLRLVFITGISRFSRVSIFSELNNLYDLTMHTRYATMLGYTQAELEHYFTAHIQHLADNLGYTPDEMLTKLGQYYDGYRFSVRDAHVYNPYSILSTLGHGQLGNYWFETGTPTFLINLLREKNYPIPQIEGINVDEMTFGNYDIRNLQPEALLFQSGYVTIHTVEGSLYHLGYPNHEVKLAFSKQLLFSFMSAVDANRRSRFLRLSQHLQAEDFDAFFETITAIFASIPYDIQTKRDEAYYHTLFYLMVSASGVGTQSSTLTSRGRIDMVVELPDKVYLIEFKCNHSAAAAIQQIQDKGYAEPYQQSGKKIILIGINFSTQDRTLAEWQIMDYS